jgi:hypothetical protein
MYVLPPKTTITALLFINEVLVPVENSFQHYPFLPGTPLLVHYDNARAHTCKLTTDFMSTSTLERLPHPPYSPDISPCDFFLFGYLKHMLQDKVFENASELAACLMSLMAKIPPSTYLKVFNHWLERLDFVIESGGKYFNKKYEVCFFFFIGFILFLNKMSSIFLCRENFGGGLEYRQRVGNETNNFFLRSGDLCFYIKENPVRFYIFSIFFTSPSSSTFPF